MDIAKVIDQINEIASEKNINKEHIFEAIEQALLIAARRRVEEPDEVEVRINRTSGELEMTGEAADLDINDLGRIAAQTAKQVIIQRVREAERDQVHDEFFGRRGEILTGTVQRMEGREQSPNLIINIGGRVEAFFPRKEQIFDERFNIGDRVRAVLLDVRKQGQKVKLILSRADPIFVRKLFAVEVPEISDRIIEIKAIEREAGYRSKVAVASYDAKVDCVGACVGQRGSRIRGIIDELNGEKIDIVRWNDSPEILIQNALKPARISSITLDYDNRLARIVVPDDQLSLAIGKRGQNVRLGAKLCRWDFNIITETQEADWRQRTIQRFKEIEGMTDEIAYKIFDAGFDSFADIYAAGPGPLMAIEEVDVELAAKILQHVQDNQTAAETIEDTVFAHGAFRSEEGTYLEPGQARPGEFRLVEEGEIPQPNAADAASRFDSLFGGPSEAAEGESAAAQPAVEKVRLGDIFAFEEEM